ncbi:MAG: DUF1588 domain-containing protein [Myxococcales bacterium]|nr:DUF1588 domain-containing protein [Myxococcales bacterium]
MSRRSNRIGAWTAPPALVALLLAGCLSSAPPPKEEPEAKPDMATAPPQGMVDAAQAPLPDLAQPPPAPTPDLAPPPPPPDLAMRPAIGADPNDPQLALRELNYGLALRTASLKLLGDLPTSDELFLISIAADPRKVYEQRIDAYLQDPRFSAQMIALFRNAFRMGGTIANLPSLETAPTFAARLVAKDQPFTALVTASTGTCPTFANGTFTDVDCKNNVPSHAGVLTNPGVQAHYFSNMAFRRVRWVQETLLCKKFPAEYSKVAVQINGGLYTGPWPFDSIAGGNMAPVDFKDTKSAVCANCHVTMNHLAPLFAKFDDKGVLQPTIQVTTPVGGLPKTLLTDWLPQGEDTAWRFGTPAADLPSLGKAIAQDPGFASCVATRLYGFAMSKDDVVNDSASIPEDVLKPYLDDFVQGGFKAKSTLRMIFTSDDFVRF